MNRWIDGLPFCSRSPPADPDPPTSLNRCSADTRIHRPETAQISRSFYLFMSFKHLIDGVKCHAWGIYVIWCGKQYQDLWWSIKFQKGFSQFLKWFILLFEKKHREPTMSRRLCLGAFDSDSTICREYMSLCGLCWSNSLSHCAWWPSPQLSWKQRPQTKCLKCSEIHNPNTQSVSIVLKNVNLNRWINQSISNIC